MRKVLIAVALAAVALVADGGKPEKARCAFCYPGTCFSSANCGAGCACLKRGLDVSGSCFSVGALPVGWERVP